MILRVIGWLGRSVYWKFDFGCVVFVLRRGRRSRVKGRLLYFFSCLRFFV